MKRIVINLPDDLDPTDKGIEQSIEAFVTEIDPEEKGAYWEVDDVYPLIDWQTEVANGDTRLGYQEWVEQQRSNS